MRPSFVIAAALAALASPALAQDAYVVGITAALTGPPASTYAPAIEALRIYLDRVNAAGGVNGKKVNLVIQDDFGRAVEGGGERQEAADAGQRRPDDQRQPVLDLRAGGERGEECRRAAAVRRVGVPEGCLSAGRRRAVLHHRVRVDLRQPRGALLHQGDREGAGEDRLLRDGDPALARRDRFRRKPGARARHDGGRQGDHPAADRRLHAVRHQDKGRRRELGVLLGAMGDAGAHLRGAAPPRLDRRLSHLGASRGRRRTEAHQGRQAVRHRRECAVRRQPSGPEGDRGRREAGRREVSARADDRRLDRRHGDRGRAEGRRLARDARRRSRPRWRTSRST